MLLRNLAMLGTSLCVRTKEAVHCRRPLKNHSTQHINSLSSHSPYPPAFHILSVAQTCDSKYVYIYIYIYIATKQPNRVTLNDSLRNSMGPSRSILPLFFLLCHPLFFASPVMIPRTIMSRCAAVGTSPPEGKQQRKTTTRHQQKQTLWREKQISAPPSLSSSAYQQD